VRVRASRQDDDFEHSALNVASFNGLAGTVAKLLALGADATLTDEVRACVARRGCHTYRRGKGVCIGVDMMTHQPYPAV